MSGSEYLDKIIHLPFCIPVAAKVDRLDLVRPWLKRADTSSPIGKGREQADGRIILRLNDILEGGHSSIFVVTYPKLLWGLVILAEGIFF